MTTIPMAFDDALLDDPTRLAQADTAGLLRATAMAGAQVRATAEVAAEVSLADRLDVGTPRALVLIARQGISASVSRVLSSLLADTCPMPVVVTDVVPSWVGALDVVIGHTADPGDRELASSLDRACRYGATVVLSGPSQGPVASAVAGRGLLVPPRMPVPAELAMPSALATGLLTASRLGLLNVDIAMLADELDAEAERGQLGHESFVNPAKSLALRAAERTPMFWGLDEVAVAIARHGAHVFGAHAALVCDAADYRQALARPALHRAVVHGADQRDIFADPEDSDFDMLPRARVFLLTVAGGQAADALRAQAEDMLGNADVLAPGEEIEVDIPTRAAVLALRFELASVYLGLATGHIGGQGGYASVIP